MNRFETYFDANYTYYVYYPNRRILKSLGLFENLAFVILSTRENIRLIARASSITKGATQYTLYFRREYSMDRSSIFGYNVNVGVLRPPASGIWSARKTPSFMHPLKASINEFWLCPATILRLYSMDRH